MVQWRSLVGAAALDMPVALVSAVVQVSTASPDLLLLTAEPDSAALPLRLPRSAGDSLSWFLGHSPFCCWCGWSWPPCWTPPSRRALPLGQAGHASRLRAAAVQSPSTGFHWRSLVGAAALDMADVLVSTVVQDSTALPDLLLQDCRAGLRCSSPSSSSPCRRFALVVTRHRPFCCCGWSWPPCWSPPSRRTLLSVQAGHASQLRARHRRSVPLAGLPLLPGLPLLSPVAGCLPSLSSLSFPFCGHAKACSPSCEPFRAHTLFAALTFLGIAWRVARKKKDV